MLLSFIKRQCDTVISLLNKKLARFHEKSNKTLIKFDKALAELKTVNNDIDSSIATVDTQMIGLANLKFQLAERKESNAKISEQIAAALGRNK